MIGALVLLLCIIESSAITCPVGALRCELNVNYMSNDIGLGITTSSFQDCYDICINLPRCMAVLFKNNQTCFKKYRLDSKASYNGVHLAVIADNTARDTSLSCQSCSINTKCQDMQAIKLFSIMGSPACVDQHDEIYFGDYNNDGICDAVCFSRSTLYLQWGVGTSSMNYLQPTVSLVGLNQGNLGVFCDSASKLYTKDVNADGYDDLVCEHVGHFQVLFSDANGLKLTSETVDYEKDDNCPWLPSSCLINIGCTSEQSVHKLIETPPHGIYELQAANSLRLNCHAGYIRRGQTDGIIFCDGLSKQYQRTSYCQKLAYNTRMYQKNQKAANMIGFSYFESSNPQSLHECFWGCKANLRCQWLSYDVNKSLCLKFEWQMKDKQLVDDYNSVVAWFAHD